MYGGKITIGTVGEADLQGISGNQKCPNCGFGIHPRPFAIEVKTPKGIHSDDQKKWQKNVWERRGGLYVLARSVSDVNVLDL